MIQAIVNRMAANSLECKKWSVALASAFLGWAAVQTNDRSVIAVAFLPPLAFWYLDGFYLNQERLFRKLYDTVRTGTGPTDFCMKTDASQSDIPGGCWTAATFLVHVVPIGLAGVLMLVVKLLPK